MIRVLTRLKNADFERINVRRHAIGAGHRTQGADAVVGAVVAHYAHGADGQQNGEGLPYLVVQAGAADFIQIHRVGQPQYVTTFLGHFAGDADGEAGSGKRVAADELVVKPQLLAQHAHFVFEQFAQRLDQLHIHPRRQTANIMVALDRHRWPAGERHAFDHIGIESPLRQEIRAADFLGFFLKHIDKFSPNEFAFFSGSVTPANPAMKRSSASTTTRGI